MTRHMIRSLLLLIVLGATVAAVWYRRFIPELAAPSPDYAPGVLAGSQPQREPPPLQGALTVPPAAPRTGTATQGIDRRADGPRSVSGDGRSGKAQTGRCQARGGSEASSGVFQAGKSRPRGVFPALGIMADHPDGRAISSQADPSGVGRVCDPRREDGA